MRGEIAAFVDTNVLVYAVSTDDPRKQERASGFWTRVDGERLLIAKAPGRSQSLGRCRVPTFDCPAR